MIDIGWFILRRVLDPTLVQAQHANQQEQQPYSKQYRHDFNRERSISASTGQHNESETTKILLVELSRLLVT